MFRSSRSPVPHGTGMIVATAQSVLPPLDDATATPLMLRLRGHLRIDRLRVDRRAASRPASGRCAAGQGNRRLSRCDRTPQHEARRRRYFNHTFIRR